MDIDELPRRIAAGKPIVSLNVRDDRWPEVDSDGAVLPICVFEAVQFSYPSSSTRGSPIAGSSHAAYRIRR